MDQPTTVWALGCTESVATALFASSKEPPHHFSLLKLPSPPFFSIVFTAVSDALLKMVSACL